MRSHKPHKSGQPISRPRPGQDIILPPPRIGFPDVGMTLSSYSGQTAATGVRQPLPGLPPDTGVKPAGKRRLITLKRAVLVLLIIVLGIGGWLGFKFAYNAHKLFGGSIFSILSTTKLKGEDSGRVNILLAGNSADDPGHQGAQLTDSIMIMSIDTKNNTAFLLSVPRDLWVDIPGAGYEKINDAYVVGQQNNFNQPGYFPGGMGQLQQIVQQDFGITLDYYALVDYTALRDSVNAVGGIDVNIQSDDLRGLYDPSIDYTTHEPLVDLTNGEHHLDGQQALDLARARGDTYGSYGFPQSDFDRTQNQRMMLVALKSKAVSAGVLANPAKLSSLSDAIGNNVTTDFSLSEVHRLYDLVKPIPSKSIQSLSLNDANGKNLLANYDGDGESALIPAAGVTDFNDIRAFVQQQISSNPVVREDAEVVVLNATDTNGLAGRERTTLTNDGINVAAIGDAETNQATTTIIDASNGSKPATRQFLVKTFGNSVTTVNPYANIYNGDFIVVLGANLTNTTTTSGN
jgi:LCP family protein required for cell wall assembly